MTDSYISLKSNLIHDMLLRFLFKETLIAFLTVPSLPKSRTTNSSLDIQALSRVHLTVRWTDTAQWLSRISRYWYVRKICR